MMYRTITHQSNSTQRSSADLTYDPYAVEEIVSERIERMPFGSPPSYNSIRLRPVAVTYTFSRLSFNSMILLPPPDSPDTRSLYHISVNLDCFNPLSSITTVKRGAHESGEFVAEFESGISMRPASIHIAGRRYHFRDLLKEIKLFHPTLKRCMWLWQGPKHQFKWNCCGVPYICHDVSNPLEVYARFTPPSEEGSSDHHTLEIMPTARKMLDDIIVTSVLMEQQRLVPDAGDMKRLFNFKSYDMKNR